MIESPGLNAALIIEIYSQVYDAHLRFTYHKTWEKRNILENLNYEIKHDSEL